MSKNVFLEVEDVKPVYCGCTISAVDVTLHGQTARFNVRHKIAYKILDEGEHRETFFKKGTEAAFDLIKELYEIYDTDTDELYEIFNYWCPSEIIENYDYEEIKELLDKWKKRIVVGDEIFLDGKKGIVISIADFQARCLTNNGLFIHLDIRAAHKTDKHFDEIAKYIQH